MDSAQRRQLQGPQPEQSDTFLAFSARWTVALDAGLTAAAELYRKALREKLMRGYTSGKYTTGKAARKISVSKPNTDRRDGNRVVRVYGRDFVHRLWEFGHFHGGRFLRVEHWRNTMNEQGERMAQAFHDAFAESLASIRNN